MGSRFVATTAFNISFWAQCQSAFCSDWFIEASWRWLVESVKLRGSHAPLRSWEQLRIAETGKAAVSDSGYSLCIISRLWCELTSNIRNSREQGIWPCPGMSAIESERHWLSAIDLEWPSQAHHPPQRPRSNACCHLAPVETIAAVFRLRHLRSYTEHTCRHEPSFARPQDQWIQSGSRGRR